MGEIAAHAGVLLAAALTAALTLFSGFGLGTLLFPVFRVAAGASLPAAVAATAVVHLANNLFKVAHFAREARRPVILRFGLPAIAASVAGALLLESMDAGAPLREWSAGGRSFAITPLGLAMGGLFVLFAALEVAPATRDLAFPERMLPIGGLLSGFLGGISGHQGALRAAFLARAGLTAAGFIGTSAVIASMVDVARLSVYGLKGGAAIPWSLVGAGILGAFLGVRGAAGFVRGGKVTIRGVQIATAVMLAIFGVGLAAGIL